VRASLRPSSGMFPRQSCPRPSPCATRFATKRQGDGYGISLEIRYDRVYEPYGVDGSSPSEGLKDLQNAGLCCLNRLA
jgi:hypothetical protein